jgi:hypothetical protein
MYRSGSSPSSSRSGSAGGRSEAGEQARSLEQALKVRRLPLDAAAAQRDVGVRSWACLVALRWKTAKKCTSDALARVTTRERALLHGCTTSLTQPSRSYGHDSRSGQVDTVRFELIVRSNARISRDLPLAPHAAQLRAFASIYWSVSGV